MKYLSMEPFDEEIYQYIGSTNSLVLHSLSGISFPDPNYEIRRDNSHLLSLEYIYEGEGAIQQNNFIKKVKAGDFFILHPNTYHHYLSSRKSPWKKIFVTVDGYTDFIMNLLRSYNIEDVIHIPNVNDPLRLEDIFELVKNDDGNIRRCFENLLFLLIGDLADFVHNHTTDNSAIIRARQFIDKRITTRITVKEVADYIKQDVSYFGRQFKSSFGLSPVEYITNEKIKQSKILLTQTSMTMQEIAVRFSFTDSAHYTHTFKKITGITPTEYRIANTPSSK